MYSRHAHTDIFYTMFHESDESVIPAWIQGNVALLETRLEKRERKYLLANGNFMLLHPIVFYFLRSRGPVVASIWITVNTP